MKTTKEKNGNYDQTQAFSELAETARKNYEQALRTGLKFQEEAWQSWCAMVNQSPFGTDWQKRYANVFGAANSLVPAAQKRMEETVELMEKNARLGAELMKKAVDAAQTTVVAEGQAKWMDFMKTSLEAAQYNVEAAMRINSRAMDSFLGFVQKNSDFTHAAKAS